MIEPTISLGNVIGAVSIIITVVIAAWRANAALAARDAATIEKLNAYHVENRSRLAALEVQVQILYEWFTKRMERRETRRSDYDGG